MGTRRFRGSLARSSVIAIVVLSLAAGVAASNSNRLRADMRGTNEVNAAAATTTDDNQAVAGSR